MAKSLLDSAIYYTNIDPGKAMKFARASLESYQERNQETGIAIAYNSMGEIHRFQGNYDTALVYHLKSLTIDSLHQNFSGMGHSYSNLGVIDQERGQYSEAQVYFFRALFYFEKLPDTLGISVSYGNIGNVYAAQGNFEKSREYFIKAKNVFHKTRNIRQLITATNNIGSTYFYENEYDSAMTYYLDALKLAEAVSNKHEMAMSHGNIGAVCMERGIYDKANHHLKISLKIREEIDDKSGMALTMVNIGDLYDIQSKYKEGLQYKYKALDIAENIGVQHLAQNIAFSIARTKYKIGEYRDAFDFYKKGALIKDSLFSNESSKQIAELETKYQTERKQKEIEYLQQEKLISDLDIEKQRLQKNSLLVGIIVILLIVFLLYNRYLVKQKANKKLSEAYEILEVQQKLLHEKNKDITDSINYAKTIQEAILPYETRIQKTLDESFVLFKPKDIVSGDFYWFTEKDGKIFLAVVDCTGHGVPGAFMSMIGSAILNHIVGEMNIISADLILTEMHKQIRRALKQHEGNNRDGMDLNLCVIDKKKKLLEFAGAMNPLHVLRNGNLEVIKGDKHPIGGLQQEEERVFTLHQVNCDDSLTIYLATDGYADQFGGIKGKKFKYSQLKELLLSIHLKPMKEQREILDQKFEDWKGDLEQVDDMCIIGLRL